MTGDEVETVEDAVAVETSEEDSEEGWPDLFRPGSRVIPPSGFGACHRTTEPRRRVGRILGEWDRGVGCKGAALRVEGGDGDADGGDMPRARDTEHFFRNISFMRHDNKSILILNVPCTKLLAASPS